MVKARMLVAGLFGACMAAHAADESFRLAHAKSENVEVFVDHAAGQPWCSPSLRMRFVFGGTPPEGAIGRLMPKLGGLLDSQCPQTGTVQWQAVDGSGQRVALGSASKVGGWATQPAAGGPSGSTPGPGPTAAAPSAVAQSAPVAAPSARASATAPPQTVRSGALPDIDIVGIRPGMSEAEVRRILERSDARYDVQVRTVRVPLLASEPLTHELFAQARGGMEKVRVGFAPPPQAVAIRVEREVGFPQADAPTFDGVVNAVLEKYGKPTVQDGELGSFRWFFDASGTLLAAVPKEAMKAIYNRRQVTWTSCSRSSGESIEDYFDPERTRDMSASWYAGGFAQCGNYVIADVQRHFENKELARVMVVSVHAPTLSEQAYEMSREIVLKNYADSQRKAVEEAQTRAPPKL